MSKFRKPDERRWPGLREYWESYGHSVKWDDLVDYRERSYDGLYVVLAWDAGDGEIGFADIAGGGNGHWEMQNDSERCSVGEWRTLRAIQGHGAIDGFTMHED